MKERATVSRRLMQKYSGCEIKSTTENYLEQQTKRSIMKYIIRWEGTSGFGSAKPSLKRSNARRHNMGTPAQKRPCSTGVIGKEA